MTPFWVETGNKLRIAIVPRPRGGDWLDDEIRHLKEAKIDILVSMLQQEESEELGLTSEETACVNAGIEYLSFPIPDRETPSSIAKVISFVDCLREHLRKGQSVAVHCRASIGRSSLLLASVLCAEGFLPTDAFQRLSKARGLKVPDTTEQIEWVEKFYTQCWTR